MTRGRLIWKNASRRKLRLILTVLSVFTAFLIFGVLVGFNHSINQSFEKNSGANRLITVNKVSFIQPIPMSYVARIRAIKGVKDLTHASWMGGYYSGAGQDELISAFATDPESYFRIYPEILLGDKERKAFFANRTGAVVGAKLAQRFGWQVGQTVPIKSNIWVAEDGSDTWPVKIEGIFTGAEPETDTTFMLLHYEYLNERRSFGADSTGWLVVATDSSEINDQVAKRIDGEFENSPMALKTDNEQAFAKAFLEQYGNLTLIITTVVGAAFFTILLIAGNTMMLAIRERTAELAVLKTLGFSDPSIFTMVLFESLLIVTVGGLLGLLLASILLTAAGAAGASINIPHLSMSGGVWALGVGCILVLGLITGFIPAFNAMRTNVVTALGRR